MIKRFSSCLRLILPALMLIFGITFATAATNTWYVPNGPGGTNTFSTLSLAVASTNVVSGDTIVLNTNLWTECGILITNKSITITGLGMTNTILQGATARSNATARVIQAGNASYAAPRVNIQNMTIQYGYWTNTSATAPGGAGIYNYSSTVTVQNCVIRMNDVTTGASNSGGSGIAQFAGTAGNSLILSNCIVSDNFANGAYGGGVYI